MTPEELAAALSHATGEEVLVADSFGQPTADVPIAQWVPAAVSARDDLGYRFFDWLSAVDELDAGFSIVTHLWSVERREHLLLRTRVPRDDPRVPTLTGVYAGAAWHERETFEMFGVVFDGHPLLVPLLLPEGFEGHPLRKEFVLASRVAKPWPGAKEPGESDSPGGHARRRVLPPGVPSDWGPDGVPADSVPPERPRRARRTAEPPS